MNNKSILFFLITLIIYINIYIPLSSKNQELKQKMTTTLQSIKKDQLYIIHKNDILKQLEDTNQTLNHYINTYFYNVKGRQVFSLMQKKIKEDIKKSNVLEDNIQWGESYKTNYFKEFPISIRVYGAIKNIGKFFDIIQNDPKLHIKTFTIRYQKKFYILEVHVFGLKQANNV